MVMRVLLAIVIALGWGASDKGLDEKVRSVMPTAEEELWLSIPWRLNLMEARKASIEQGKPMFLWIMNGHPMGCT